MITQSTLLVGSTIGTTNSSVLLEEAQASGIAPGFILFLVIIIGLIALFLPSVNNQRPAENAETEENEETKETKEEAVEEETPPPAAESKAEEQVPLPEVAVNTKAVSKAPPPPVVKTSAGPASQAPPAPAATAAVKAEAPSPPPPPAKPDNLTKIEGIGPKTDSVLKKAGINTFQQLANTEVSRLSQILDEAGFRLGVPDTWPEQAKLAAAGEWKALDKLQDELKGGRRAK